MPDPWGWWGAVGHVPAHAPPVNEICRGAPRRAPSGYNEARAPCAESCAAPTGGAAISRKISRKKEPRVRIRERPGRVLVPSAHRARGIAAHGRGLPTRSGGLPRLPRRRGRGGLRRHRPREGGRLRTQPHGAEPRRHHRAPAHLRRARLPPVPCARGAHRCEPGRRRGHSQGRRPAAGRAFHRGSGRDAGRLRGRAPERLARPGAFGSALRLRAARQRGRGARYGGRQLRRRLPARVRQGIQGAHRAHCRRGRARAARPHGQPVRVSAGI